MVDSRIHFCLRITILVFYEFLSKVVRSVQDVLNGVTDIKKRDLGLVFGSVSV